MVKDFANNSRWLRSHPPLLRQEGSRSGDCGVYDLIKFMKMSEIERALFRVFVDALKIENRRKPMNI
jgi:hypothetical protein